MMRSEGAATVYDPLDFMRSSTLRFDDEQEQ